MFPAELSSWTSFSLLATPSPSHPTLSKDKICLVQDLTAAKRSFNCDQTALSQYHSKKQSTVAKNYKSLSILQHQTWSAILLKHRIESPRHFATCRCCRHPEATRRCLPLCFFDLLLTRTAVNIYSTQHYCTEAQTNISQTSPRSAVRICQKLRCGAAARPLITGPSRRQSRM